MPKRAPDYFRYFAPSPETRSWGLEVTACGRTRVAAGTVYPPTRHPEDHHFDWEHGRVLEALQVVFIGEGRGEVEYVRGRGRVIEGGMAFVLPPNAWHRYRPDAATGWTESWMEVRGSLVNRLRKSGAIGAESLVKPAAGALEEALEGVHVAAAGQAGFSPGLAAAAYRALAVWATWGEEERVLSPLKRAVVAAERELAERHMEPVNMEELARELGVAYSHFRRAFKAHTGFAPWQYVLNLRLGRARRLLAAGEATLEDIAARLGFSSAFHLSAAFKQAYGVAPDKWRRRLKG